MLSAVLRFLSGILNAHCGAHLKGTLRAQSDSDPVSLFCLIGGRLALNLIYCSSLNFCTEAWTFFNEFLDVLLQSVMWAQSLTLKIPGAIWYKILGLKTDIFMSFNNLQSIKPNNAHEFDRISRRCPHSGEYLYYMTYPLQGQHFFQFVQTILGAFENKCSWSTLSSLIRKTKATLSHGLASAFKHKFWVIVHPGGLTDAWVFMMNGNCRSRNRLFSARPKRGCRNNTLPRSSPSGAEWCFFSAPGECWPLTGLGLQMLLFV